MSAAGDHAADPRRLSGARPGLDQAVALFRRHAGPGPRVQAGLLRGHLLRRRPDRPAARRRGPAGPARQHDHRLLERPRLPPRRARAVVEAELLRGIGAGAADHLRAGPEGRGPGELAAGRAGRSLSDAGRPGGPDAAEGIWRARACARCSTIRRRRGTTPAYTQVQRGADPGHSVRTERWRYTEWDFGAKGQELYDHDSDPQELHNLAGDAKYAEVVAEMKSLLKQVHPERVLGGKAVADTRAKFCD